MNKQTTLKTLIWLLTLLGGVCVGTLLPRAPQAGDRQTPVYAAVPAAALWLEDEEHLLVPHEETENLFAAPSETPCAEDAGGFAIQVLGTEQNSPAKRVLIYHSHTFEAYAQDKEKPYRETEKWRTADSACNVVRVGEELAGLLRGLGFEVVHDVTAFEPPNLSSAYTRSLEMLTRRKQAGERYDLYIDLHRDAYIASQNGPNTVMLGGKQAAKLMLLIGKGEGQTVQGFAEKPDWQANFAMAQRITANLNEQAQGLCRDVCLKSGRYNQHVAAGCVLIEAGNNRNTLQEVLAAMPYLADAIADCLMQTES